MPLALVLVPLLAALLSALPPKGSPRRGLLVPVVAAAHLAMVVVALRQPHVSALGGWLVLDELGKVFLLLVSVVAALCASYVPAYLGLHRELDDRAFVALFLAVLGAMTLVVLSHHLGLCWVAMEACALGSAPLIDWGRSPRSLEALWKYLVLGSVGIAVALLGTFFLAYSALRGGGTATLQLDELLAGAPSLSVPWMRAAGVLLLVGWGTKVGLAPMHAWKPDAYGEAPAVVATLLSGGISNCAILMILRYLQIAAKSGDAGAARQMLIVFGLVSLAVAAAFMTWQHDFKRMLAYSSVEHAGLVALGVGLGGVAIFGALLHVLGNALAKGALFLCAGNIHRAFGSKSVPEVRGASQVVPWSAGLFVVGFFAISGTPPFGTFASEWTIVSAALSGRHYVVVTLMVLALLVVFVGMGSVVFGVVQGAPQGSLPDGATEGIGADVPRPVETKREAPSLLLPIGAALALVLLLGIWLPPPLSAILHGAAATLEVP